MQAIYQFSGWHREEAVFRLGYTEWFPGNPGLDGKVSVGASLESDTHFRVGDLPTNLVSLQL
jgi:hypothetical protein